MRPGSAGGPPRASDVAFELDREALVDGERALLESYAWPSFEGFSDLVFDYPENRLRLIREPGLQRTYIDALTDLHLLVEEYRCEALLALVVLRDYRIKRDRGDADALKGSGDARLDTMPWPAEAMLVARRYGREPPSPAELFARPHQQIAGNRILSRWFAAQLLDSALYRGIAACDRLAIMLRCRAGLSVERTKAGEPRQPSFGPSALRELDHVYGKIPHWKMLHELASHVFFDFIKQERNGFTHERRRPSELHGERAVVYGSEGPGPQEVVPALDAGNHYALAPAFYNEILRPAIEASRTVLVVSAHGDERADSG
jgi:hypothetical protein